MMVDCAASETAVRTVVIVRLWRVALPQVARIHRIAVPTAVGHRYVDLTHVDSARGQRLPRRVNHQYQCFLIRQGRHQVAIDHSECGLQLRPLTGLGRPGLREMLPVMTRTDAEMRGVVHRGIVSVTPSFTGDGVASKQIVSGVREPLARAATAAAPLMRCSDPAVVAATEQLLNALADAENTARLETALEASGRPSTRPPHHGCPGGRGGAPSRRDDDRPLPAHDAEAAGPQVSAGPQCGQRRVSHHRISSVTAPLPSL
jgi:hypothetical protein